VIFKIGADMKRWYMIGMVLIFAGCYYKKSPEMRLCNRLDWQSVLDVFPKNTHQIQMLKNKSITVMNEMLETLKDPVMNKPTFHNTVRLYDNAQFKFLMNLQILSTISLLSTDSALRLAAHQAVNKLQQYKAEKLVRNPTLLKAFQNYAQRGNDDQSKTIETRSFLQKSINRLEHEGASLSHEVMLKLKKLSKEIDHLQNQFNANIAYHDQCISIHQEQLGGVPAESLATWKLHNHEYSIPLTYDAFFTILENCTYAHTRQTMFIAFHKRAYPANMHILEKLIEKRNEYARLVGYKNFAEYDCSLQMIGSVQKARDFIYDIVEQTNHVVKKQFAQLVKELPSSVTLSLSGKLQPWDEAFVKNAYRKKHYNLDSQQLAQYFPLSHVLQQLQQQFGQFFALAFDEVSHQGLWDKNLICLRVRLLQTSEIIGYLVFDLYARPGKSEQAYQLNVIPTIQDDCNLACSGMSTIVTNFTQAPAGQETLLEFHDVKILLHEFGHALHALFGATKFVDLAGTQGPQDFLEMPSQLFEMWMDSPVMIKLFSQHYQTKKPLSDSMIEKIIAAEKFSKASLLQRECLLSLISLELGAMDESMDIHAMVEKLYTAIRCDVQYHADDYFEASFDHLVSYGSHYYGYVWSQVLAAGLFEYVCKHGITNTHVGQKLYDSLLSHGGSQDPHTLIEILLGTTVTKKSLLHSLQS
jgi:Zn-dependent oligopeptidase